jgi:hypothetical protein
MISSVQNELVFDANELPTGFGRYQKAPFGFGIEPDRADVQEAKESPQGVAEFERCSKRCFLGETN